MQNNKRQAGTEVQQSDEADVTMSSSHNAKPLVARSLVCQFKNKMKQVIKIINYVFSKECPIEVKSQAILHGLSIALSVLALVVSLVVFFLV